MVPSPSASRTRVPRSDDPVVVVGGGVIGLCVAHYLADAGVGVEVVERATLASGASWGNAGWVCQSHSMPVPAPGVTRYVARSLAHPESAVYLRPTADLGLVPWLWRFWRHSSAARFRRGYAAIAELNRTTFDLFDGLDAAGVDTSLRRPGIVHAFLSVAEARRQLEVQRALAPGRYELPANVTMRDAHHLDPSLAPGVAAAYLVPGEGVVDPERFVRGLGDVLAKSGGRIHEDLAVTGFRRSGDAVVGVRTSRSEIACSAVVIASGMWSHLLLRDLGFRLPLQAGKGYSFSVDLDPAPQHALFLGDRRIVASPINGTTRLAGTIEFSGNNRRLDWRRIVGIAQASRHYLGQWFDQPDELAGLIREPWVGGRPFLPDGLPVIDRLPGHANVFVSTGHGMLGVTLGPASGKALSEYIVGGHRPDVLAPFGMSRIVG